MEVLKNFVKITEDPARYLRHWKDTTGGTIIGTLCSYVPEEIVTATGALSYRLLGAERSISRADSHLQSYCCAFVRSALDQALNDELDWIDGMVFPHTCDSIQRLSDIWRLNTKFDMHFNVNLPVKLNTESAETYLKAVLQRFKNELEIALKKKISNHDLQTAASLYNAIRENMRQLYRMKSSHPKIISGHDLFNVNRASMVMERHDFLSKLEELVSGLKSIKAGENDHDAKRVFLTGSVCYVLDIYNDIEKLGMAIVGDDLCTGYRYHSGVLDESLDPLLALTKRFVKRAVCPAKHHEPLTRAEDILRSARENNADGVIFLRMKFCDPHAFDYPMIKELLEKVNIPTMLLEFEEGKASSGPIKNRLEAFAEMI